MARPAEPGVTGTAPARAAPARVGGWLALALLMTQAMAPVPTSSAEAGAAASINATAARTQRTRRITSCRTSRIC